MPQAGIPQDEEEQSYQRNQDSDVRQLYWLHADVQVSCSGDYYQREYYDDEQDLSHITYEHSSDYQRSEDEEYEENFQHEEELDGNAFRNQEEETRGLTQTDIELIPKMSWGAYHGNLNADQKCSICLSHYAQKESLRVLTCLHRFHQVCVDKWLLGNRTCPVCRTNAQVET